MPKGWCPEYFYNNPNLEKEKSLEDIWTEIQYYSGEFFADDNLFFRRKTDFIVPLPPLQYEGKFLKGLYLSEGVDYIHSMFPRINELFISMAYTMWSSIPYSNCADVFLTCYDYPAREAWFKQKYPNKSDKTFIPLQDADFTNEYVFEPIKATEKDIDVLCVARLSSIKNLHILVEALKLYQHKYGKILKTVLITGCKDLNYSAEEKSIVLGLENIAGGTEELRKYLEIVGRVPYGKELNKYYSRSRFVVLPSIYEGKNRVINESVCCDTPVIVFKDLCKYTRGQDNIFPVGAGLYVPEFSAEALCDKIHEAMTGNENFTPRQSYLKFNGRMNFLNKCIDYIPYYKENLPSYVSGNVQENRWLDFAMQDNYQLTLKDFLYGAKPEIQQCKLSELDTAVMDFYNEKFNIRGNEKVLPLKRRLRAKK